jgi:hypothetical protein
MIFHQAVTKDPGAPPRRNVRQKIQKHFPIVIALENRAVLQAAVHLPCPFNFSLADNILD